VKALIIYDSVFGNTEKIARAIGGALGSADEIALMRAGEVRSNPFAGLDLLIVGSPTRGFQPTEATKNLLGSLPSITGVRTAAFDTRMAFTGIQKFAMNVFAKPFGYSEGYASTPIAQSLNEKGGISVVPPEGFFVKASEGPLKEGELERAAEWARQILEKMG
jgi:flavodoxin